MKLSEKQIRIIIKESILDTIKGYFGFDKKEKQNKRKPRGPIETQKDIALYFEATKKQGVFVLYEKTAPNTEITAENYMKFQKAIGYLRFITTNKPCILKNKPI